MGFYDDRPPPHGHRSPADLAENEMLEALHGNVCAPWHASMSAATVPPTSRSGSTVDKEKAVTTLPTQ